MEVQMRKKAMMFSINGKDGIKEWMCKERRD